MKEEFGSDHSIEFDEHLGKLIDSISYKHESYENWLSSWVKHADQTQSEIKSHMSDFYGSDFIEIARSPIVNLGGNKSFAVLFAQSSEILLRSIDEDAITINKELLIKASEKMRELEDRFSKIFITDPGTFESSGSNESVPLTASLRNSSGTSINDTSRGAACCAPTVEPNATTIEESSVYVSVSGIPNQKLDGIMNKIDLPVITNKDTSPHILADKNIVFQVARSGWGACWMSVLTSTPLITPEYDPSDDPEIYFNNKRIEELGIGLVHKGESINELLPELPRLKKAIEDYRSGLIEKYETLNGAEFVANKII